MPPTHRTYDKDFRQEAVNLLLSSGRPLKRVAAELGVTANSLRTWRNRAFGRGRVAQAASAEPKGRSEAPLADPAGEIRHFGFLSNRDRTASIEAARALLNDTGLQKEEDLRQQSADLSAGVPPFTCPHCGSLRVRLIQICPPIPANSS
jgi:transposase